MTEAHNIDCMDAMAQMKDNEFDLAIVDPPYGIGNCINSHGKKRYKKMEWNDKIPNKDYFTQLKRVSKNQIIWGINYYTEYIKDTGRIVHDKSGGGQFKGPWSLSDADLASHSFGVTIKIFHYGWSGNRMGEKINSKNIGVDSRFHPTQKPVALYKWLLKNYAKEGDKILDTHLGSGSSRIAAHDMGFDFVGYEIDKDYFDAQELRFNNHIQQQSLFNPKEMYQ